jgi:hypothetical protein
MGYSGYTQHIGACGHQWEVDSSVIIYGFRKERKKALICGVCGAKSKFTADVDVTNGSCQDGDETSFPAPMKKIGHTDTWHTDHYGNKYAVMAPTFEPVGDRWRTEN